MGSFATSYSDPRRHGKLVGVTIALALFVSLFGGAAVANHNSHHKVQKGGPHIQHTSVTESQGVLESNTSWQTLAGTGTEITVPPGNTYLVTASFNAQTGCFLNSPGLWCQIRILARNVDTGHPFIFFPNHLTSLHSQSWVYGFKQTDPDAVYEQVVINRSRNLGPGRYRIWVQHRVDSAGIAFDMLFWSLDVDVYK